MRPKKFFPTSCLTQEREKLSTEELPTRFAIKFFCPTSCSNQESEGFFFRQATYKGTYEEAVESARAGLSPKKGDVRKKRRRPRKVVCCHKKGMWEIRKEKDQGRREGGSCKGKVPFALHQEFFFLVHEYSGLEAARLSWSIGSYETWSTRKPCAKEVPETDYFTQRKQYLERTTLRRLKIPLRSIRSKEGPHYCLGAKRERESCHLTSNNQPLFTSWITSGDSILGLYCLAWLTQESVSLRIFVRKKGMSHDQSNRRSQQTPSARFRKEKTCLKCCYNKVPTSVLLLRNSRVLFQKHGGACTMY